MKADKQHPPKRDWGLLLFSLLFTAFGLYITYGVWWSYQLQQDASITFRPIEATVLESHARETAHTRPGPQSSIRTWSPYILYQYQVDGITHTSQVYQYIADSYGGRQAVESIVARYPPGSRHTAWYNPDKPSQAVLVRGMPTSLSLHIFIPLVFVAFGLLGIYGGWNNSLEKRKKKNTGE